MVCYHELKDENFPTATSVASLQPKSLQTSTHSARATKSTCSPSFTFHTSLIHWHVLMKGNADSQFKRINDTEENGDTIHDIRGVEQEV